MCAASKSALLFEGGDLMHPSDETFRLVRCTRCGHIYQNPRPSVAAIDKYYPPDYMPFWPAIEDEASRLTRWQRYYGRHKLCAAVHREAGCVPGSILDVGCATGIFLDGMRQLGWRVKGVEPMHAAANYARTRFQLDVFEGRLEDARFPDRSFDAITLWDVLEHVHEPTVVFAELARLLRPGGLLVLSLPNPDGLEARLFGPSWVGWDLPRHLNLFHLYQLRVYLPRYGLSITKVRSFLYGYANLALSIVNAARRRGKNSTFLQRLLFTPAFRLMALPYYAGPANWYNLSSTMVVFARRG
jgi:SAM-dependent methyltransferase